MGTGDVAHAQNVTVVSKTRVEVEAFDEDIDDGQYFLFLARTSAHELFREMFVDVR